MKKYLVMVLFLMGCPQPVQKQQKSTTANVLSGMTVYADSHRTHEDLIIEATNGSRVRIVPHREYLTWEIEK